MRIIKGSTRIVLVCTNVAIKVPNFTYSWLNFIKGLTANMLENHTWKYNSGEFERGLSYLLCPVLWASYGGWVLVMRKADKIMSDGPFDIENHLRHFPGDDTTSNYGILDRRLVKIDYGSLG